MVKNVNDPIPKWVERIRKGNIEFDSHVRLFIEEGITNMDAEDFQYLIKKYIDDKEVQKGLEDLYAKDENKAKAKSRLFKLVSHYGPPAADGDDINARALLSLVKIISRSNDAALLEHLMLKNLDLDYYAKLYAGNDPYKMDRISAMLYPAKILPYLETQNVKEYEPLIVKVKKCLEVRNQEAAACLLLRSLPYCSDSMTETDNHKGTWYFDFLNACLDDPDGYNSSIPRFINPDFKEELNSNMARKQADSKIFVPNQADIADSEYYPEEPRPQKDYVNVRPLSYETYWKENFQAEEVTLRPYQVELACQAITGRSTIICAPTGSGKTHVVTHIIKGHMEAMELENKVARAVMLVPTIPLVDQQAQYLLKFLLGKYYIDGISGVENFDDRAAHFLTCNVVVMTPQILINMLSSILKKDKVYFSDISLMIFDECHHCNAEHPYKVLMEMLEESIDKQQVRNPLQIVGLTASMGVGTTGWDIVACRQHMLTLCSNLMVDTISTVRHQLNDLKNHVRPPADRVERVENIKDDPFTNALHAVLRKIQDSIKPELEKLVDAKQIPLKKEEIVFPNHENWNKYQNVVGNIRAQVEKLRSQQLKFSISRKIQHLSYYFQANRINELLPEQYTLEYLESKIGSFFKTLQRSDDKEIENVHKFLRKIYETFYQLHIEPMMQTSGTMTKPILAKLYAILNEEFTKKGDPRCLIFVQTRACARNLSDHLKKVKELPMFYKKENVSFMVSTNQSSYSCGQTSREQQEIQDSFKKGTIKVLVVTSVAEEGIDIADCNLIIKYNSVGSERSLIQRRGRARAKDSKSILLALDNAIEQQEFQNIRKEALMHECVRDLQEQEENVLRKMILDKSAQQRKWRDEKLRRKNEQSERLRTRRYKLKCKKCSNFICESYHVRQIANNVHVCCDPMVWSRSLVDRHKRPTKDGLRSDCAKWLCKCCNEEWGQVIKYSGVFFPTLLVGAFLLERLDTKEFIGADLSRPIKNWQRIQEDFFNVDQVTVANMKDMYDALMRHSKEKNDEMEQQDILANMDALEKVRKLREKEHERKQKYLMEE